MSATTQQITATELRDYRMEGWKKKKRVAYYLVRGELRKMPLQAYDHGRVSGNVVCTLGPTRESTYAWELFVFPTHDSGSLQTRYRATPAVAFISRAPLDELAR